MALITRATRCAICGEGIGADGYFATSGVWLPPSHPLFRFCDAAMHWGCYASWEEREPFARSYFDARAGWSGGPEVFASDEVRVTLSNFEQVSVGVLVAATAVWESVPLDRWECWLRDGAPGDAPRHEAIQAALERVLPVLRRELPTAEIIEGRADWRPMREAEERFEAEHAAELQEREAECASRNRRTDALLATCRVDGLACPFCGESRTDHTHRAARSARHESYLVCAACGRSFTAADVDEP